MKYLYESHLGSIYTSDSILDDGDLYCEQCGDRDWFIGSFKNIQEFWELIEDDCDINGGCLSLQYIYPIMVEEFDLPDDVKYERDCGFCCNSDEEILERIHKLTKENSNVNSKI